MERTVAVAVGLGDILEGQCCPRHVAGIMSMTLLADIERVEQGELECMLVDRRGETIKHLHPRARRQARPYSRFEGAARGGDGEIDLGGVAHQHGSDHSAVCRVDCLELLPGLRIDELTVDQHPRLRAQRRGVSAEIPACQRLRLLGVHRSLSAQRSRTMPGLVPLALAASAAGTEQHNSTCPSPRGANGSSI